MLNSFARAVHALVLPLRVLVAFLPVATVACSSSNGADTIGQYCDLMAPCCAKAGLPANGQQCRSFYSAFGASVSEACLTELRAAQSRPDFCTDTSTSAPSCQSSSQSSGTKAPGEPCSTSSECAASAEGKVTCRSSYDAQNTRTSACQVQISAKAGEGPCAGTVDGKLTSYIGTSSGPPPAKAYLCDVKDGLYCPYAAQGASASCARIGDLGSACGGGGSYDCVKTAYCDGTSKTCKARLAVGETCDAFTNRCAPGAYCDGTTKTCTASLPEGAACTSSSMCATNTCNNKKCEASSLGSLALILVCGSK